MEGSEDSIVQFAVECSIPVALVSGVAEDVLSDGVDGVAVGGEEDLDSVPYVVNARAKKRKRNFFPTVSIADWDLPVQTATKLANDDGKKAHIRCRKTRCVFKVCVFPKSGYEYCTVSQ